MFASQSLPHSKWNSNNKTGMSIIEELLGAGADALSRDNKGKTLVWKIVWSKLV